MGEGSLGVSSYSKSLVWGCQINSDLEPVFRRETRVDHQRQSSCLEQTQSFLLNRLHTYVPADHIGSSVSNTTSKAEILKHIKRFAQSSPREHSKEKHNIQPHKCEPWRELLGRLDFTSLSADNQSGSPT